MKLSTVGHLFVIFLFLGAFALPLYAQDTTQVINQPFSPAPYKLGERLTYNVTFANFVSAAHIEMLVAGRGTLAGREGIMLKAHAETIGMVNAALFAINNDYITYVDPQTGLPFHAQQVIRSATNTSETSAEFNQPAGTAALPEQQTAGFLGTFDFLSAVYRVRALPLQEGMTYRLAVRGEGVTYDIEVKVKGRAALKTNVGSFETIGTEINVRNNSRADNFDIKVFFSDDPRHVPVLLTAKHSAGRIRVELAGSEFIATPTSPPGPAPKPVPVPPAQPGNPIASPANDGALSGLPFRVGEQLNYRVFLPGITLPAGEASFTVRARSKYFDRDGIYYSVGAKTTNALQHLFFANDVINSYVDPKTLLPYQTELNLMEGRFRASSKLKISQDYGTITTEKGDKIEIPVGTHDYVSFFYALRTFNLSPPRKTGVSILVNNKPKTLFIESIKREAVQIGSQTIPAIQLTLTTDDAQPDKYQLRVWISDDSRRLPLRITALTKLGALRADLAIIPVTSQ
ncbi:MAG TPA: DUF3108 domain-containing protein [Pyrinomonadaceae bacterium]|nr:DUF3108 domain-containing protein [Pyrinomonadaceae bacterium]